MHDSVRVQGDFGAVHDLKIRPAAYMTGDRVIEWVRTRHVYLELLYIWAKVPSRVEKVLRQGHAPCREMEIELERGQRRDGNVHHRECCHVSPVQ